MILLDLDAFKQVNDTLGHGAGDAVLREVAARLRARLHPGVLLARLGSDEYAILTPRIEDWRRPWRSRRPPRRRCRRQ